jgi:hypothetical protein
MAVTNTHLSATRRSRIGPVGTTARIVVGTLLVGSVAQGHLARGFHPSAWALGLVVSNWLLRRDDQMGCAVFWPIDQLEHHRTAQRT